MVRPMITVAIYLPTELISARNSSPPPVAPSLDATKAKIPIGERYMIQMTSFIMTSFRPSKKFITTLPFSPMVVKAAPKNRQKRIMGSSCVSAAAATRFGLISEPIISAMPTASLAATLSGMASFNSLMPMPGCMMFTMTSPTNTAIAVVLR